MRGLAPGSHGSVDWGAGLAASSPRHPLFFPQRCEVPQSDSLPPELRETLFCKFIGFQFRSKRRRIPENLFHIRFVRFSICCFFGAFRQQALVLLAPNKLKKALICEDAERRAESAAAARDVSSFLTAGLEAVPPENAHAATPSRELLIEVQNDFRNLYKNISLVCSCILSMHITHGLVCALLHIVNI